MSTDAAPEANTPARTTASDSAPARGEGARHQSQLPGGRPAAAHGEPGGEPQSPRVAFQTLGCKLNQYETDSLAADFATAGYTIVPFEEGADVYVLNTCTVTNRADRKSRNLLYRTLRAAGKNAPAPDGGGAGEGAGRGGGGGGGGGGAAGSATANRGAGPAGEGPADALVVLTGCFAEGKTRETLFATAGGTDAAQLSAVLDGRRLMVVDNPRKARIVELVEARRRGEVVVPGELDPNLFGFHFTPVFHTRTTIKVQDGCDNFCTYCIVPYVRGHATSRPADAVVTEVAESVSKGAREIVLTGVNMSRYRDGTATFSALVERVLELPGDFRVRISSLEPDSIDERFFAVMQHPKMCPHLHLCLQSGSDRILLKMRRQYDTRQFRDIVTRIRTDRRDFNFTTDIIVGFPGETEEDFAETVRMAREIGFSHIHTFPYSLRSRTRAARMSEQIPHAVKTERAEVIRRISDENKRRYRESLVGATQQVLVERPDPGESREHGYGELYVPVRIDGAGPGAGSLAGAAGAGSPGGAEAAAPGPAGSPDAAPELTQNSLVTVELTALTEGAEPVLLGTPRGGSTP